MRTKLFRLTGTFPRALRPFQRVPTSSIKEKSQDDVSSPSTTLVQGLKAHHIRLTTSNWSAEGDPSYKDEGIHGLQIHQRQSPATLGRREIDRKRASEALPQKLFTGSDSASYECV